MSSENSSSKNTSVITITLVIMAFIVGVMWQKVSVLENSGSSPKPSGTVAGDVAENEGNPPAPSRPATGKLPEELANKFTEVSGSDHIAGNKNAKVFLVEYSDFECPYCQKFHSTAQQVVDEYGGDVAWVYRHFPLDQLHPKARPAAVASECVTKLGGNDAFWVFTNAIYEDQTTQVSKLQDFASLATDAGVSLDDFTACIDSGEMDEVVEKQYKSGLQMGITGTPGNLVVNQKGEVWLVPGALPFEQIKTTIDEALSS